jgi:hypothetical protein
MYNDFLSQNDDDLFSNINSSDKQSSKQADNVFKEIEELLSKTSEKDFFNEVELRSKLVNSFNDSANRYIFSTDSFNRSLFDQLNILTNGLFTYRVYADLLEESLVKRLVIFNFLKLVASSTDDRLMNFITKKMRITFDEHFVKTYINSAQELLDYAIRYNIEIYTNVCQKIQRTPQQALLDRRVDDVDLSLVHSDQYINKYFSVLRTEMGFDF